MTYDLAIIGAGPAGMAAAATASRAGLGVALIDSGLQVGGQFFRQIPYGFRAAKPGALHHGFSRFVRLRDALGGVDVLTDHRVWAVETGGAAASPAGGTAVHCLAGRDERPRTIRARRLLIATGAYDRTLPFPGWDLPGVLTAGGAQALLKGNLVAAGRRVVVAGTGPFLLPVAAGLAQAGCTVVGVFEANNPFGFEAGSRFGPVRDTGARFGLLAELLAQPGKAAEAAGYVGRLARHRVPYRGRHAVVAAHGDGELTHVSVARVDRDWRPGRGGHRTIECDTLAVSYGFVPQLDLPVQLGCEIVRDRDGSPVVRVDPGFRTSVPGVYAAGETTGVGGADLAVVEGVIAARAVVTDLAAGQGGPDPGGTGAADQGGAGRRGSRAPARLGRQRERLAAFAGALQAAYPVRDGWTSWLRDDTLVCRCEEVPYSRVKEAQELGATDARSIKLLARPGMGWCQGRVCGYAVARLAGEEPAPPRRPIAQPIRLGDLAGPHGRTESAGEPRGEDIP